MTGGKWGLAKKYQADHSAQAETEVGKNLIMNSMTLEMT